MYVPLISSALFRIARTLARAWADRAARQRTARVIRHIEDLPPYLLHDIGLTDRADVAAVVGQGRRQDTQPHDPRCGAAFLPHSA